MAFPHGGRQSRERYGKPGVGAVVGATDGFGTGGLVAVGNCGGGSTSTARVDEGKGDGDGFPVFEFWFVFSLAPGNAPPISIGLSLATGDAETFALVLAFAG